MPGMRARPGTGSPNIVNAFHAALVHRGLIALALVVVVAVAWSLLRSAQLRQAATGGAADAPVPEPRARRLVRVGFGLLWVFDGVLQGQASMPLGLVPGVIRPAAATSPPWVRHLTHAATTVWTQHPVTAAASMVWIQVGLGVLVLAAPRGTWSRLAGAASAGWALLVWALGEAFGGVFAPGLTWLFGAPGAALLYAVAGVLLALPEPAFDQPVLGRTMARVAGGFFVGMGLLQAWPGRGFWHGRTASGLGTLASMVRQMAGTPQPRLLASWVAAFGAFDAAHGWAVNLAAVTALATIGTLLATARPGAVRVATAAAVVLCLADWVLVEDLGFLGGVGTDPNSMVPMALLLVAGAVALASRPTQTVAAAAPVRPATASREPWRQRLVADPTYTFRVVAALAACAVMLVGAVPMVVLVATADPGSTAPPATRPGSAAPPATRPTLPTTTSTATGASQGASTGGGLIMATWTADSMGAVPRPELA